MSGNLERGAELTDQALQLSKELRVPEALGRALLAKAILLGFQGRPEEARAHLRHALLVAEEHDVPEVREVGTGHLSDMCFQGDRYDEALELLTEFLARARRLGGRRFELYGLAEISYAQTMRGRWDEALAAYHELRELATQLTFTEMSPLSGVLSVLVQRGDVDGGRGVLEAFAHLESDTDIQGRTMVDAARAELAFAEGRYADALRDGSEAAGAAIEIGAQGRKHGLVWAVESALALEERDRADELLGMVESLAPGLRPPYLEAHAHRLRGRMNGSEDDFKTAESLFRDFEIPFWLAVTQLEHGEWLVSQERRSEASPLFAEAQETFERLEAQPWVERLERSSADDAQAAVAS